MSKIYIDDLIKEFEEKSKNAQSKYKFPKDKDELYDVDIHIWRHPGMSNSLQTISGNKVSIMTAICSFLTTLCLTGFTDFNELREMIDLVEKGVKYEKRTRK